MSTYVFENRIGKITIKRKDVRLHWKIIGQVLAKIQFVPVQVEMRFVDDCLHLVGLSPDFEISSENMEAPDICINATIDDIGNVAHVTVWVCKNACREPLRLHFHQPTPNFQPLEPTAPPTSNP